MSLKTHSASAITLDLVSLKSKPPTWETQCLVKEKLNVSWLEVSFPLECPKLRGWCGPSSGDGGRVSPRPHQAGNLEFCFLPVHPSCCFDPDLRQMTLRPRSLGRCQVSQELSVQQPYSLAQTVFSVPVLSFSHSHSPRPSLPGALYQNVSA